jgi:hypothetical protein
MEETFVGVRNVNEETFRKFRALAIEKRLKLGEALTKAMALMLEKKEKEQTNNAKLLLKMKPIKIGKKVRWSEEIDEVLYGFKR